MIINTRINGALAQEIGVTHLRIQVEDAVTVADLLNHLRQQYPQSGPKFDQVVPIAAGQHLSQTTALTDGQEVALLLPVAGG